MKSSTSLRISRILGFSIAATGLLGATAALFAAGLEMKALSGHVPAAAVQSSATGLLQPTERLRLAIGLPLRDASGLDEFLAQVYDPASPTFRRFLTPEQFTERFGPTTEDYQAVAEFARTNGLSVAATHANRLLLDVTGCAADIQRAFHITLRTYSHPSRARDFFAPDTEPSVEARLPICDISGLNDYDPPHPMSLKRERPAATSGPVPMLGSGSGSGSGPGGGYLANDFRAAYLPDVTLTGDGQMVGLLEFDGFYANDITAYETVSGLPSVPIQTVLLDGFDGVPASGPYGGSQEVTLDIEMAMAMAPGLSSIVVFEAGPAGVVNDGLSAMAATSLDFHGTELT